MSDPRKDRGTRNNNPGNIRHGGGNWYGLRDKQTDAEFVQFNEQKWGLRAVARNLLTYGRDAEAADGTPVDTLKEAITRWAPPFENDTPAYIEFVSKATGFLPDDIIDLTDPATLRAFTTAIIKKETGTVLHPDEISDAVALSYLNAD